MIYSPTPQKNGDLTRVAIAIGLATLVGCRRTEREPSRGREATLQRDDARREAGASSAAASADAAAPPRNAGPIRFAIVGDYGAATQGEAKVAALIKSWDPEFVLTTGDNNYPAGEAATIDANVGQFYSDFIGNYRGRFGRGASENRFWPTLGNHDWIAGITAYLDYFTLPGNERYYDVDFGLVHVYALDSDAREPDGVDAGSRQAAWLEEKLRVSRACYNIVYFHHPAYSTSVHGPALPLRWPFRQWGADAVVAGHDHTYERSIVDGMPYFVNGLGGASKYDFPASPAAETQYRYNDEFGAMRVVATPAQIKYEFLTIDGNIRDTYVMPSGCTH